MLCLKEIARPEKSKILGRSGDQQYETARSAINFITPEVDENTLYRGGSEINFPPRWRGRKRASMLDEEVPGAATKERNFASAGGMIKKESGSKKKRSVARRCTSRG